MLTVDELCDTRTGVYVREATQQKVALAFSGENMREIGSCSLASPQEVQDFWESEVWRGKLPQFAGKPR